MLYREFEPHPLLRDYIKTYWYSNPKSVSISSFEIMPDAYFDLIIYLDNSVSDARMTGIWNKMITVNNQNMPSIAIRFKPLALTTLFRAGIGKLLNGSLYLDLKEWGIDSGLVQDNRDNLSAIISYFDQHFLSLLAIQETDKRLKAFFELVDKSSGTQSVDWFSDKVGLSPRQLQRKVNELIGISPKEYTRIVRFKHSLRLVKRDKLNFVGYFDQSHFIKDFKYFTGLVPSDVDLSNDVRFLQYYDLENS